ncbi:MAG: thermosome subunit alpha, partial [Halobacteria archaeon]|nr:thermosome subunit alpha [Halobacteria archaeon]
NVKIETIVGGSIEDSELVEGMIIDKERVHSNMPKNVTDANILLLDTPIELQETETDTEISVSTPDELQHFLDKEEEMIKELIQYIKDADTDVVFCQKGIDDMAQHYLAKEGIFAVRRVKKSDMKKLARATGAKIVSNLKEIEEEDLGFAGVVEERTLSGETMIFVEETENPKSVSLILRGGTEHVVDEVERAVDDALGVVRVTLKDGKVVPGGSAPEVEVALGLRDFADSVGGREQLAIEAFANALEIVPHTLAENAGLDSIDTLVELRNEHDAGDFGAGINAYTGGIVDMEQEGVVEPLRVKTQALESATEAAVMILRIDDVIAAGDLSSSDDDMDF